MNIINLNNEKTFLPWEEKDSDISNLLLEYTLCTNNIRETRILSSIILIINSNEKEILKLPFLHVLYYEDNYIKFLEESYIINKYEYHKHLQNKNIINIKREKIINATQKITSRIREKELIKLSIQKDIILTFICKILSEDIVIGCLEKFSNEELRELDNLTNDKDLIISAICNNKYAVNIINYLLTRDYVLKNEHLIIATLVGNTDIVHYLLENSYIPTLELFNQSVFFNYPKIVELYIEYFKHNYLKEKLSFEQLISIDNIKYAIKNSSLEILENILRYTNLVKLGFENSIFSFLINDNWCFKSFGTPINLDNKKSKIILYLIKKGLKIDLVNNLISLENINLEYDLHTELKEIFIYYSNIIDHSIIQPIFIKNFSISKIEEIIKKREFEKKIIIKKILWSNRKYFLIFRQSIVKYINNIFIEKSSKKIIPINKSIHVFFNKRFGRHITSFLGLKIINWCENSDNDFTYISKLDFYYEI